MFNAHPKTEQLLAQAKCGDASAVNQLIACHRNSLNQMVRMRLDRKIRNRVDASDVVQEVLLEANRRLQTYLKRPAMPFHMWLRQIAKDRIIDAHRRHRASAKRSVDREQPLAVGDGPGHSSIQLASLLSDDQLTPATSAMQRELARKIEGSISELEDKDSEVILMRHYEHLTNQEISRALGLTQPAASMRYLRAIRNLRELLQDPVNESSSGADEASEAPV